MFLTKGKTINKYLTLLYAPHNQWLQYHYHTKKHFIRMKFEINRGF